VPKRIISLAPSATSILYALGAEKSLIGVTRWCRDVAPVNGIPALGDCWRCNPEEVAALKPDLVIGSVPYKGETVAALVRRGLTFLAMNPRTLADISADVEMLGRLLGREKQAQKFVGQMKSRMRAISARARKAVRRPRVYSESWPKPLMISPVWVEEMVGLAGGRFVPSPGGRMLEEREVLAAKPEIIILAWAACGMRVKPEKILRRPGWAGLPAVRNRQVFVVSDEALNTPGPPVVAGLERLAKIIHPEIFGPPENEKVRCALHARER